MSYPDDCEWCEKDPDNQCRDQSFDWTCTCEPGHDGDHIACMIWSTTPLQHGFEVWPKEGAEPERAGCGPIMRYMPPGGADHLIAPMECGARATVPLNYSVGQPVVHECLNEEPAPAVDPSCVVVNSLALTPGEEVWRVVLSCGASFYTSKGAEIGSPADIEHTCGVRINELSDELASLFDEAEPAPSPGAPDDPYRELHRVLMLAYQQAAHGKGLERHGQGLEFKDQPIIRIRESLGSGFTLGQATKKIQEAQRLAPDHAGHEMLGAIVYLAAEYFCLERDDPAPEDTET